MATDALFAVRNALYLGAAQSAISEAAHLTGLSDEEKIEKEVLTQRAYVELGSYDLVMNEIDPSSAHKDLVAVRVLADVYKATQKGMPSAGSEGARVVESAMDEVKGWMDVGGKKGEAAMVVAALVLSLGGEDEMALKACQMGGGLENMSIAVHILVKMDRVDLAGRQVAKMSELDDDATLTQLAAALVGSRKGGRALQEAYYIYQELGDKYTWTVKLHNGLACCQMQMERWEDAEGELLQAFEKNAKDADTLGNLAVVSLHLGKPATRYVGLLDTVAPHHPLAERMKAGEAAFETACEATA